MILPAGVFSAAAVVALAAIHNGRRVPDRLRAGAEHRVARGTRVPTVRCAPRRQSLRAAGVVLRRALLVLVVVGVAGPIAGSASALIAGMWPRVRALRRQKLAVSAATAAYPDLVDLLVLGIRAGSPPRQALEAMHDLAPLAIRGGIEAVLQRLQTGQRFAEAISALHDEPPSGLGAVARPLVDALALADRHGTPLAPVLDRLSDEAKAHRRRTADAAARRLPVQLSFPLVGCTLPSFVLLTIVPLMAGTLSSLRGLTP